MFGAHHFPRGHFRIRRTGVGSGFGGGGETRGQSINRLRWPLLSCRPEKYIFKYTVGVRQAKTLAMTRGWGLDVCSIARSTFRCLACPCVVLGGGSAYRPVPKASTLLQPFL